MNPTTGYTQQKHYDAECRMRVALDALAGASDPAERHRLLLRLADQQAEQAQGYTAAFGPDPVDDEGTCTDLFDSLWFSANLYAMLAGVEAAVALGTRRVTTPFALEAEAGAVLDRMAATPVLADRMRMLRELIDAVVPVAGGQAAETLWCLPAPGFSGPLTLAEKDAWFADQGYPAGTATGDRRVTALVLRLVVAAGSVVGALGGVAVYFAATRGPWYAGLLVSFATVAVLFAIVRGWARRQRNLRELAEYRPVAGGR